MRLSCEGSANAGNLLFCLLIQDLTVRPDCRGQSIGLSEEALFVHISSNREEVLMFLAGWSDLWPARGFASGIAG